MSKKFVGITLALALASSVTVVALADADTTDEKIYSGSFCIGRVNTHHITDRWRGRAYNLDTNGRWLQCSFVRDVVSWGGSASGWVKVVDRHYYDNVSCALWSQNTSSSDGWSGYSTSRSSSGSSTSVQTLSFSTLSDYSSSSTYSMECLVPGTYGGNASQIVAYSITES